MLSKHLGTFLDEFPGLPVYKEIMVCIDLDSNIQLVSILLYYMALLELPKLTRQMDESWDKGFLFKVIPHLRVL